MQFKNNPLYQRAIIKYVQEFNQALNRNPKLTAIFNALKRCLRKLYFSTTICIASAKLQRWEIIKSENLPNCKIAQFTPGYLEKVITSFGKNIANKFEKRYSNANGYLIFNKDEIIGYFWTSVSPVLDEGAGEFIFDIAPRFGNVYIYDGFIAVSWRSIGIMTSAINKLLYLLKNDGYTNAFILFSKDNRGTMQMSRKLRMNIDCSMRYRKILGTVKRDLSASKKLCE